MSKDARKSSGGGNSAYPQDTSVDPQARHTCFSSLKDEMIGTYVLFPCITSHAINQAKMS